MITEFLEIRNFFDDPQEIINIAKQQTFVQRDSHYHNEKRNVFYNGVRSKSLKDIDPVLYKKVLTRVFEKIIDSRFSIDLNRLKIQYNFKADTYFHVMREQDKFNSSWVHKDEGSILAGLIYLNPNPRPNTGTLVHRDGDDKEPVNVENEFNKMVIYNASYLHAPAGGFGTDINDSRLTLVFFINAVSFRLALDGDNFCDSE